jgi:hypothetical protein
VWKVLIQCSFPSVGLVSTIHPATKSLFPHPTRRFVSSRRRLLSQLPGRKPYLSGLVLQVLLARLVTLVAAGHVCVSGWEEEEFGEAERGKMGCKFSGTRPGSWSA